MTQKRLSVALAALLLALMAVFPAMASAAPRGQFPGVQAGQPRSKTAPAQPDDEAEAGPQSGTDRRGNHSPVQPETESQEDEIQEESEPQDARSGRGNRQPAQPEAKQQEEAEAQEQEARGTRPSRGHQAPALPEQESEPPAREDRTQRETGRGMSAERLRESILALDQARQEQLLPLLEAYETALKQQDEMAKEAWNALLEGLNDLGLVGGRGGNRASRQPGAPQTEQSPLVPASQAVTL